AEISLRHFVSAGALEGGSPPRLTTVRNDWYGYVSWRVRLNVIPSFSMRLRRVFGWSLRIRAAPLGPWITPAVDSSAATMCRRSISSKGAMSSGAAAQTPANSFAGGASAPQDGVTGSLA